MKVFMQPNPKAMGEESGIRRVVEAYYRYLPKFGVEFVGVPEKADVVASHVYGNNLSRLDVCHNHGLYWTGDYKADPWEWKSNADVIMALRMAEHITVPSTWVAKTIARDMRVMPTVIGHGIDWEKWQAPVRPSSQYVLWNKNRLSDACDPTPLIELAKVTPSMQFVSTFLPKGMSMANLDAMGLLPHEQMKKLVKECHVYLATTKETFGIGILEAMASGVPVLGYAWGGILDLVQHGVNGYLAQPGDIDDLRQGLIYCLRNHKQLGENGREMAKAYTWQEASRKVFEVYKSVQSGKRKDNLVSIIIPTYNYANRVGRAIESALAQTYKPLEVIVVDDGSTDDTEVVVAKYPQVRYIKKENGGVARARNRGIEEAQGEFVCCLDADDAIAPMFVEACMSELKKRPEISLAFTGLQWIKPDGTTGTSPWPAGYDFDKQLKRQNQVPTCCVFRRKMWQRLGGYSSRYCPQGAGSEDAEFWTRAGAAGFGAVQATVEPLFIYSWQSGRVSGNKAYEEVDWLGWHPYSADQIHPFASMAKPEKFSHPVHSYDEPKISIVIPVGPGHEERVLDALDSIEAQTYRDWEVIIVWDTGKPVPQSIKDTYPHATIVETSGSIGAGAARNAGVEAAIAPLLLFLDADDYLAPQALYRMATAYVNSGNAIYTDYVGMAFIDNVDNLAADLRERIYDRDPNDGWTVIGYRASDYDCERAQAQPEPQKPYLWNLITTLFPRSWHDELGGFDETMKTWEDVDYWWRAAKLGKCFERLPEELIVYRFYTGKRREVGIDDFREHMQSIVEKHKEIKTMPCPGGCGKKSSMPNTRNIAPEYQAAQQPLQEGDLIAIEYKSPTRGEHMVIGVAGFPGPLPGVKMIQRQGAWFIKYGYFNYGDKFYAHRADIQAAPNIFVPLPEPRPVVELERPKQPAEFPPPAPVAQVELDAMPQPMEIKPDERTLEQVYIAALSAAMRKRLASGGITTLAQLCKMDAGELADKGKTTSKRAKAILAAASKL